MLKTISDLEYTSPLVETRMGESPRSCDDAQQAVGLADVSGQPLFHVRGLEITGTPPDVGQVIKHGDGLVARLRTDVCLYIGVSPGSASSEEPLLTTTDITHGRGHFLLLGEHAPDVLPKVCGLDFSDRAFPDKFAAQTSLAKVSATIVRHDSDGVPVYHIVVGASVAAYVWDVVFDAMAEFGGMYVG